MKLAVAALALVGKDAVETFAIEPEHAGLSGLHARRECMQRSSQLDDRRFDLLGRHDTRAQPAMQAERMRVALSRQHAGCSRALACPQHAALRSVFIDDDDGVRSQLWLCSPDELQRQRR